MENCSSTNKKIVIYLSITILWTIYIFILNKLYGDITPFFFNFLCQSITAIILIFIVPRSSITFSKLIIISFLWGIVYQGCLVTAIWIGIDYTTIYTFAISYIPFRVILQQHFGTKKSHSQFLAILISYVGIIICSHELGASFNLCTIFLMLSALGALTSKFLLLGIKDNSISLLCYISLVSSVMSLIISYNFENPDLSILGKLPISSVIPIVTSVILNILIFTPWIYLHKSKANEMTTFVLLVPILGTIILLIISDDIAITYSLIIGMGLNSIGIIICLYDEIKNN